MPIPADSDIDFGGEDIRGDANGGVYIIRMDAASDGWTCVLEHATDLLSPHTLVAKVEHTGGCSTSFAVDGDPMSATMVVTGKDIVAGKVPAVTAVTLPVAAVLP